MKTLRLRETSPKDHDGVTYSNQARDAVESLTTLSELHFLSSQTLLMRLNGKPVIRKMDLPISSQMLFGCESLEQLILRIDIDTDPTYHNYKWDDFEALEFVVDPQLSSTPELFLRKLLNQVRTPRSWPSKKEASHC